MSPVAAGCRVQCRWRMCPRATVTHSWSWSRGCRCAQLPPQWNEVLGTTLLRRQGLDVELEGLEVRGEGGRGGKGWRSTSTLQSIRQSVRNRDTGGGNASDGS